MTLEAQGMNGIGASLDAPSSSQCLTEGPIRPSERHADPVKGVFRQFFYGAKCFHRGLVAYASTPRLWKYAAIPTLIVTALYLLIAYILYVYAWPTMRDGITETLTAPWISWAAKFLAGLAGVLAATMVVLLLAVQLSTIFEAVGGPFFAAMVRDFEKNTYNRLPSPQVTFLNDCRNTAACVVYALVTCLWAVLFYILSFPFPITVHIIAIFYLGFRYGIGYASEAGFNKNWTLTQLQRQFEGRKAYLYGYGTLVFLVLLVPFLSILAIPGLFIGGTILVDECTEH